MDPLGEISDDSDEEGVEEGPALPAKVMKVDFETLSRNGYKSGPSVMLVPESGQADASWEWKTGKGEDREEHIDTAEDREKTRMAAAEQTELAARQALEAALNVRKQREQEALERQANRKGAMSFNQKEKRKRDMGQAQSSKNFVEEEKRILRQAFE